MWTITTDYIKNIIHLLFSSLNIIRWVGQIPGTKKLMHHSSNTLNKVYYIRTLIFKNLCWLLVQIQMAYRFLEILFTLLEKWANDWLHLLSQYSRWPTRILMVRWRKGYYLILHWSYCNKLVSHFSKIPQQCHKACPSFSKILLQGLPPPPM